MMSTAGTSLMLVEEITHRVLNQYMQAIAGLRVAARDVRDEAARQGLMDAADRLYAHAHVHRALAMPVERSHYMVCDYLAAVCSAIANALAAKVELCLKAEPSDGLMSSDRCWLLALILSEFIHNAVRHGDYDRKVMVQLAVVNAELLCEVSNSASDTALFNQGRGRRVVTELARELDGYTGLQLLPTSARAWVTVPLAAPTAVAP